MSVNLHLKAIQTQCEKTQFDDHLTEYIHMTDQSRWNEHIKVIETYIYKKLDNNIFMNIIFEKQPYMKDFYDHLCETNQETVTIESIAQIKDMTDAYECLEKRKIMYYGKYYISDAIYTIGFLKKFYNIQSTKDIVFNKYNRRINNLLKYICYSYENTENFLDIQYFNPKTKVSFEYDTGNLNKISFYRNIIIRTGSTSVYKKNIDMKILNFILFQLDTYTNRYLSVLGNNYGKKLENLFGTIDA